MSETPTSIRNIPPDALQMAQAVSKRLGISVADVLRLSLVSGTIIELIKAGPDQAGQYAGFSLPYLASVLRRHLAAPIDLLLQQGQHPYQDAAAPGVALPSNADSFIPSPQLAREGMMFDEALEDELAELGLGGGLAADLFTRDVEAPV